MKKIVFFLIALFILALVGIGIFLFTFDVNSLKPYIQEQIEKQVGQPVEISSLSLGWQNGISLNVKETRVYKDKNRKAVPLLQVESINGKLSAGALLQSRLEVSSITIDRMKLHIRRSESGEILGLENLGKNTSGGSSSESASLVLLIKDIFVRDAEIFYHDQGLKDINPVVLDNIDIHVQDVSLSGPIKLSVKSSLYSSRQNLKLDGKIKLNLLKQSVELNDWVFETDLDELNLDKMREEQPMLQQAALQKIQGQLSVNLPTFVLKKGVAQDAELNVKLDDGRINLGNMVLPFKKFAAEAELLNEAVNLNSARLDLDQGSLVGSGSLTQLNADPSLNFNLTAKDIYLPQFVKVNPGEPYIDGTLTLSFKGQADALKSLGAEKTLQGLGLILVNDATLKNLNVLDQVFSSLSIIPGLVNRLKSRLSEEYRSQFSSPDTKIKDVRLPFEMSQGKIFMNQIEIEAEQFSLEGRAEANIEGNVFATLMLRIDRYLTDAFVRSVDELRYLTNEQAEMQIPVQVKGQAPKISILPNVQYIASKLAKAKAQDLISGFLGPKQEAQPAAQTTGQTGSENTAPAAQTENPPAAQAASPQQPSTRATVESLFGQLLQDVLAPAAQPAANQDKQAA